MFLLPRGSDRNAPIFGDFVGIVLRRNVFAADFGAKIGESEILFRGQGDRNEAQRRVADVDKRVVGTNGEVRRIAGNKADGQSFFLNFVAGRERNTATRKRNDRQCRSDCGRYPMTATPKSANQGTRILPGRKALV